MAKINHFYTKAEKRKMRIRSKLAGTTERPRLSIFRSNKYTYLQVINDETGLTLAAASDIAGKAKKQTIAGTKSERAAVVAQNLAQALKEKKITKICFDKGSYRYHGRLKVVAETLRAEGVEV